MFLPRWNFSHGPLEPKANMLPIGNTDQVYLYLI